MAPAEAREDATAGGVDWRAVTFEGNRRLQEEEFRALSFRDKLKVVEQLSVVAEHFARRRAAHASAAGASAPPGAPALAAAHAPARHPPAAPRTGADSRPPPTGRLGPGACSRPPPPAQHACPGAAGRRGV